jgi:hypothetical protein
MTRPVEYRHGCDTNAPDVRIFHGAKNFFEVVLLNILSVKI